MPRNPIDTLILLTSITQNLDKVQAQVNHARTISMDQAYQLELDRKQNEIDLKRRWVTITMVDVSSRN